MFDNANINFIVPARCDCGRPRVSHTDAHVRTPGPQYREPDPHRPARAARAELRHQQAEIAERIYNGLVSGGGARRVRRVELLLRRRGRARDLRPRGRATPPARGGMEGHRRRRDSSIATDSRSSCPSRPARDSPTASAPNSCCASSIARSASISRFDNYGPTVLYGTYEDGGILKRGTFDVAMYAWLSSPAPSRREALYAATSVPPHGQNHPRFANEEITRLLEQGSTRARPCQARGASTTACRRSWSTKRPSFRSSGTRPSTR